MTAKDAEPTQAEIAKDAGLTRAEISAAEKLLERTLRPRATPNLFLGRAYGAGDFGRQLFTTTTCQGEEE